MDEIEDRSGTGLIARINRQVNFLEARITEDEAGAEQMHRWDCGIVVHEDMELSPAGSCDCGFPARVLRECEAKRQLIADAERFRSEFASEHGGTAGEGGRVSGPTLTHQEFVTVAAKMDQARRAWWWRERILRHLARVYSDHPDYNPEWDA